MAQFTEGPSESAEQPSDAVNPRESTKDQPTSVSRYTTTIRDFISGWGSVWVEGEVTSWNQRGGHVFGRLKDLNSDASVGFRIWASTLNRLDPLSVGDHAVANVKADFYVKTGDFSVVVSQMRPVGLGEQLEKLERLRKQLHQEGLFNTEHKKPLPFLPQCIGLVTGKNSDAEKDVRHNAELRWPHVTVHAAYAAVQGERCVPDVIAALKQLDADPEVEVIIIARGGGDPQHLLGFSDESLIRAVFTAKIPVVSAIGHENDHPLIDDVADLRASTPTDAAKRVIPDVTEQRALVRDLRSRLTGQLSTRIRHDIMHLENLRSRPVMKNPEKILEAHEHEVFLLAQKGRDHITRHYDKAQQRVAELRTALRALSPSATLDRGYAIVHLADGTIVRDAAQAPKGTEMTVTITHGSIAARSEGEVSEDAL